MVKSALVARTGSKKKCYQNGEGENRHHRLCYAQNHRGKQHYRQKNPVGITAPPARYADPVAKMQQAEQYRWHEKPQPTGVFRGALSKAACRSESKPTGGRDACCG